MGMANQTRKRNVRIVFNDAEYEQAKECKRIRKLDSLNAYVRLLIKQDAMGLGVAIKEEDPS